LNSQSASLTLLAQNAAFLKADQDVDNCLERQLKREAQGTPTNAKQIHCLLF
jgi:hypothetical protein